MNWSVLEVSLLLTVIAILGLLLGWLLARYRLTPALVKSNTEVEAQIEALQEKKALIGDLTTRLATSQTDIKTLTNQLFDISQERSAALSKLEQMASLQTALTARDQELSDLRTTVSDLREQIATLKTTIDKEKNSFDEKISLLQELRRVLTQYVPVAC